MFGLSELNIESPQSISLATRLGKPISNSQGGEVAVGRILAFRDMCQRRRWEYRADPEGLYNCAGHVWACRRTGISRNADWLQILKDDGYRRIREIASLHPDDLVLYRDVDDNNYLHVARIVRLEHGVTSSSPPIPIVLSKWGHDLGECYHKAYDYGMIEYNVEVEFWTDRPNDDTLPKTTRSLIL
jgi:hypothetical protein